MTAPVVPKAFVWRRLHSFMGAWLAIYVIFHLLTNSQAALLIGDDGRGFIHSVNAIHDLPFLPILEILILGIPILIHTIWGIKYLRTASYNSFGETGHTPYLAEYPRNHAYTWQRITSWLLVVGIIAHVIHMRVIEYPTSAFKDGEHAYMVRVSQDDGLYTLASRLGVQLYNKEEVQTLSSEIPAMPKGEAITPKELIKQQEVREQQNWMKALEKRPLNDKELMAVSNNFGTAELLMLRDTFKMPIMLVFYTLLVLATCFHAFNGLWTCMISWGIALSQRAQYLMWMVSVTLMVVVSLLGLSAIWLTYWINLKS